MNKQEFIQEAALRLIGARPDTPMGDIYDLAVALASYVYPEEPKPEIMIGSPADEPIVNLLREIDRIDSENQRQQTEEAKKKGYDWRFNKRGYAEKVRKACVVLNIRRVSNLIDFGRGSFKSQRFIGEKSCNIVDKALKNLYNIETW